MILKSGDSSTYYLPIMDVDSKYLPDSTMKDLMQDFGNEHKNATFKHSTVWFPLHVRPQNPTNSLSEVLKTNIRPVTKK